MRPGPDAREGPIVRLMADLPFKRQTATVLGDLVLIVVAYYSAYLLRFEDQFESYRGVFVKTIVPVIVLQIASLAVSGAYRGLWRYTSVPDLLRLLQGITLGAVDGGVPCAADQVRGAVARRVRAELAPLGAPRVREPAVLPDARGAPAAGGRRPAGPRLRSR